METKELMSGNEFTDNKTKIIPNRDLLLSPYISKFETYFLIFVLVDILFLPYFSVVSISYSVPFMTIWMIFNFREFFRGSESKIFISLVYLMLCSSVISIFTDINLMFDTSVSTTFKRFFQFVICFGYYYYFKTVFKYKKILIDRIIVGFVMYVAIFALIFVIYPEKYALYKFAISPFDNHTMRYLSGMVVYRFNYFWTDPNNIAYLMCGISLWSLFRETLSKKEKALILTLSLFIIITTASNGGLIIYMCCLFLKLMFFNIKKEQQFHEFLISIMVVSFLLIFLFYQIYFGNLELFEKVYNRFLFYMYVGDFSGGRIQDLKESLNYLHTGLLILGTGKEGYSRESGHIYWIGMYGLISYVCFIVMCFKKYRLVKLKNYIWTIPFFIAFTINIAIVEFKWFAIYLLLLAESRYNSHSE